MHNTDTAIKLLEDNNLVWSSDFESIRLDLLALLQSYRAGDKRQVWLELRELAESLAHAA